MGWFAEDEATDYLGMVTSLPCDLYSLLSTYLFIVYDIIIGCGISVGEVLALKEWWGTEHTVMVIWLTLCLPAYWKRSSGNCQDIYLQLVSGFTGLMMFGSFMHLASGLQSGGVFGGRFSMPTLGLLGVVVMMFGANIDGIKKEIYGYGVADIPADEKCAVVFDSIKKFISLETAIFFELATFGLPSLDIGSENYNYIPLLSIFPILGMIRAMDTYFSPKVVEAEVTLAINGIPPQPKEDEQKDADKPEEIVVSSTSVKEEVEKIEAEVKEKTDEGVETEEKAEEKVEEKVDIEPKGPSLIGKIISKVKSLLESVKNLILTVVGKITSSITCLLNYVLSLPWNCIINMALYLGTKITLTYSFWCLTEDSAVFAFPVIDLVLPYLVTKAKERKWLTDKTGHLISESGTLALGFTHYYIFRTYSAVQPI